MATELQLNTQKGYCPLHSKQSFVERAGEECIQQVLVNKSQAKDSTRETKPEITQKICNSKAAVIQYQCRTLTSNSCSNKISSHSFLLIVLGINIAIIVSVTVRHFITVVIILLYFHMLFL